MRVECGYNLPAVLGPHPKRAWIVASCATVKRLLLRLGGWKGGACGEGNIIFISSFSETGHRSYALCLGMLGLQVRGGVGQ